MAGDPDCEIGRCLSEHGCGICVPEDEPEGFIEAIKRLRDDRETRERMGRNARVIFELEYDRDVVIDRMINLLESVHAGAVTGSPK